MPGARVLAVLALLVMGWAWMTPAFADYCGRVPNPLPIPFVVVLAATSLVCSVLARRWSVVFFSVAAMTVIGIAVAPYFTMCRGPNYRGAIGAPRGINSGQANYASSCAEGGYAVDLADLVKPSPDNPIGFVSADLSANGVLKSGYIITIARDAAPETKDVSSPEKTCNGSSGQPVSAYFASAVPKDRPAGARYFATDTRGTLFFSTMGPIPNPIPPGTQVVQ